MAEAIRKNKVEEFPRYNSGGGVNQQMFIYI